MLRLQFGLIVLFLAGSQVVNSTDAQTTGSMPFTADVSSMGPAPGGGNMTMIGKLWAAKGMLRRESLDEGHVMIVINDTVKHTSFHLVPDQGFYEDVTALSGTMGGFYTDDLIPGAPANLFVQDPANPCSAMIGAHCVKIGKDAVNNRVCTKWKVTDKSAKSWTECVDEKLRAMIQMDQGGRSFTLTNIQEGDQQASLFKVPADLKMVVLQTNSYNADYEAPPPATHPETH